MAGVDYLADLPTVIARHEGLFARHGLDVDVEFNASGRRNLERLRAGEADFALMALTPIVLDRLADPSPGEADDPVILASLVHSIRLNHVVAPVSGPVERPADLRGRRIGLHKGTNAEFVWWLFAHFHGFDPAAVELVDYPVARIPDALREGEVDAAVIWEPWLSRLREPGGEEFRSFPGGNIYAAKWVLVTTRANAREQPGRSRAVLAAYRDAIASINRDPEAAITVYARHADIPGDILRRNWPALDYALNLQWSVLATLQQQIDWALRAGHGHATDTIAVLDLIDATALRALDPSVVGIPGGHADPESRP
ncbi:NrtA/SsuA/CpmA family ABC transporter substrate-binding protein [Thiocapsa sp.]|uniref:ABC transporter substrate-binding protein n=1 Tax=Thiocapsa sp. TaxID=2024551 RepID=UPI0025D684C7|nr:NrtA/SsuA/CpmA family ABC transporter substrate-binding protein [Thiocapsa sp.]